MVLIMSFLGLFVEHKYNELAEDYNKLQVKCQNQYTYITPTEPIEVPNEVINTSEDGEQV